MSTVWTHVEYGWNLHAEIGFKVAKSEVNNSIAIDCVDMLPPIVLIELARQSVERDHAGSVLEFLWFDVGVVVGIIEVRTLAVAWVRTAIGSKQKDPSRSSES